MNRREALTLLGMGAGLSWSRIGRDACIYADHLLLSSDSTGGATLDLPAYRRTTSVFLPLLRQAGVKDDTIHAILVDNSRRFLAFVPKSA